MWYVIVAFPSHTHFLFEVKKIFNLFILLFGNVSKTKKCHNCRSQTRLAPVLKQFFIKVPYHIRVASITLMVLF